MSEPVNDEIDDILNQYKITYKIVVPDGQYGDVLDKWFKGVIQDLITSQTKKAVSEVLDRLEGQWVTAFPDRYVTRSEEVVKRKAIQLERDKL